MGRPPTPIRDRFVTKYEVCSETGCWNWTATTNGKGYGLIRVDGRNVRAHRFSWELQNGHIPEGLHVLHNCPSGDNPSCVNPDHLFLGTQADNMTDMMRKGRDVSVKGSENGRAKLAEDQVWEIFHAEGLHREIAARYGVSQRQVSAIKRKQSWKHIHGL